MGKNQGPPMTTPDEKYTTTPPIPAQTALEFLQDVRQLVAFQQTIGIEGYPRTPELERFIAGQQPPIAATKPQTAAAPKSKPPLAPSARPQATAPVMPDTTLTELKIVPPDKWIWGSGSVDDGDVSWVVPYGRIETACAVEGGNWHHWHVVACAGMDIGFTGMTTAARVLAGAGVEVLLDEKLGLHVAFGRSDHFGGRVGPTDFSSPAEVIHLDRIYIPATQPRIAVYSVVHESNDPIARLARHPRVLAIAGELMGEPVYIWASKVNVKAAWCGTAEYYHQDLVYWKDRGYPKDEMLSCMVFLEPHSIRNAALHVLPGTHRCGFIEHQPFININGLAKYMVPPATLDRLHAEHGLVAIEAEPGDALFFHTSLVHGSSHNISPRGRMILLVQLNTVGNEPREVSVNAKRFNLQRALAEMNEAERRYRWYKDKYERQLTSDELTFSPPIPGEEK